MPLRTPVAASCIAAFCIAAPAAAQTLEGRALERESLRPVPGAVVMLVDSAGEPVAAAVTDSAGAFSVRAPEAGEFAVHAARAGYRGTITRFVPLGAGVTVPAEVRMALQPAEAAPDDGLPARRGVTGRLLDDRTGQPVPDARVQLLDAREQRVRTVTTDSAGAFHFPIRSPGGYMLQADRVGYGRARSGALSLTPNDTVRVELRVSTDAVMLAPLTVVAGARRMVRDHQLIGFDWRRRTQPFGRFMDREQIRQLNPFYTTDVLQHMAAIRVEGGFTRIPTLLTRAGGGAGRRCIPTLYIDGQRVPLTQDGPGVDEMVRGRGLAAVEVYATAAMAPGEFPARNVYCGVIVIWTEYVNDTDG